MLYLLLIILLMPYKKMNITFFVIVKTIKKTYIYYKNIIFFYKEL